MRMSMKGRYGLRAVIEIAGAGNTPLAVGTIAQRQQISESYLEQLMRKLKKAGIVKSVRGQGGGYLLNEQAADLTVARVLEAVGEEVEPVSCAAITGRGSCAISEECCSKSAWQKLNDAVSETLSNITVASLISDR